MAAARGEGARDSDVHSLLQNHPEYAARGVQLVMIGGCRNASDEARVEGLRKLASELGCQDHAQFALNAPYSQVLAWLGRVSVGLNTMLDEHFRINVMEFMENRKFMIGSGPMTCLVKYGCMAPYWLLVSAVTTSARTYGKWIVDIIHLDTILRAAHLLPVFGDEPVPRHFKFMSSLVSFHHYYINKYTDHHSHEITFQIK
ncbi:unnamed protein product [Mycena citricolor]|uniref:Uncharacterized protein n=1 Tax=Mycena citricolor TaxID=2018698 RepID=A0AAD2GYP9_9AGAR|nr:unnamed protein product [Mycena citricolor]